jgi:hypothetical protein
MNKSVTIIIGLVVILGLGVFLMNGCSDDNSKDSWANFNVFDEAKLAKNVDTYYDATMGCQVDKNQVFDVYTEMSIDFGYMAYQMQDNKEFAGDIFFELGKIQHYMIEKSEVKDGGVLKGKEDIIDKLVDPAVYKSEGVDIEKGLDQLVKKNRPALLITDFEQWDQTKGQEARSRVETQTRRREGSAGKNADGGPHRARAPDP